MLNSIWFKCFMHKSYKVPEITSIMDNLESKLKGTPKGTLICIVYESKALPAFVIGSYLNSNNDSVDIINTLIIPRDQEVKKQHLSLSDAAYKKKWGSVFPDVDIYNVTNIKETRFLNNSKVLIGKEKIIEYLTTHNIKNLADAVKNYSTEP